MRYRLDYMNKVGILARLDIITFNSTSVTETIEGTEVPFVLNYKLETNDKSGHFLSSSAEINIYETTNFNIDNLKTSSETDIKVEYSIGGILKWSGFVVPDFFSREIISPGIVNMTASDRIGTLKGATLTGLSASITLRSLTELCLAKTGLSLPLDTYVTLTEQAGYGTNVMNTKVLSQRVNDNKGRSLSCYDILKSILILTNAVLVQRNSRWAIVNKTELYNGTALPAEQYINFSDVLKGARREIIPVASSVGVYQEFGGSKMSPDNYDFSGDLTGWTANGGFVGTINNKEITGYSQTYTPVYGVTADKKYLVNSNNFLTTRCLESTPANIPYSLGEINIIVDLNTIGPRVQTGLGQAKLRVAVAAVKSGSPTIWLNDNELFNSATPFIHEFLFPEGSALSLPAVTMDVRLIGKIINPEGYQIVLQVYGSNVGTNGDVTRVTMLNFAELTFEKKAKTSKGIIYKTEQGSSFTKKHDIATSIFGDYMMKGLNGYFYDYSVDDTSSLLLPDGTLTSSWNTASDTDVLPILQHVTRQISREFSIAHDIVSCEFQCLDFDPLATFRDCNLKRYTLVSSSFDYLRGRLKVQIEETVVNSSITKKDYIYSYFGDGEKDITSVGGVSGSGSSGGGSSGLSTEQLEILTNIPTWWKLDAEGNLFTDKPLYSTKGVGAWGLGASSGAGISKLQGWAGYTAEMADYYAPASLLVSFYSDSQTRLTALEAGGTGGSTVSWGTESSGYIPLTVNGVQKLLAISSHYHAWSSISGKPTYFTPTDHTHTIANITDLQATLSGKQNVLTAGTNITIAGNVISASGGGSSDWSSITNKPSTLAGYGIASSDTLFDSKYSASGHAHTFAQITGKPTTLSGYGITDAAPISHSNISGESTIHHSHTNKTSLNSINQSLGTTNDVTFNSLTATVKAKAPIFDLGNLWTIEAVGAELQMKYNGVIKQKMLNDGSFAAIGGVTAYVSGVSGYSEFLPKSGGTITGNLLVNGDLGATTQALKLKGNALTYNGNNIFYNGLSSIALANGWVIEVTTANLYIKKDGVTKGTF